jgi:uracil phosphoribosyltransferase
VHLTQMRLAETPPEKFRWHLHRLAEILFTVASRSLEVRALDIQTPLAPALGAELVRPIILVPILRAGLGMADAILPLVPQATVAHLGIARDEETARPRPYYAKLPGHLYQADVFVLDPMLATGGSVCMALSQLKAAGAERLSLISVVSSPQGLEALQTAHPEVPVVTAAIDDGLDDRCYIVPGLGDAGDRCFGT